MVLHARRRRRLPAVPSRQGMCQVTGAGLIWAIGWILGAALGVAGGFAVGWTAREHRIERRIRRNALPPARVGP